MMSIMQFVPPLHWLVGISLIAALVCALPVVPGKDRGLRVFSVIASLVILILSIAVLLAFDPSRSGLQLTGEVRLPGGYGLLDQMGVRLTFGVDSLSVWFVPLTALLVFLAVIASRRSIETNLRFYFSMIFLLEAAVLGVFTARDFVVFFLFWELELIPMYFLIARWGSGRREYSAMKFVLFTFIGSIFMLAAIIGLGMHGHKATGIWTFDMQDLAASAAGLNLKAALLAFTGFFTAFAVKLPVVPLHTWLPDAHVDAPTPVSMLLAGILLKMGGYGLLRVGLGVLPAASAAAAPWVAVLGVVNVIYAAFVALGQKDLKKLIAYSSVSHMGLVLIGFAALTSAGVTGAVFQMVAHGLTSAGLFMIVGVIYVRTHTREIAALGGLAPKSPPFFHLSMVIALASLGLPLLVGFAAESMVFYGAFTAPGFSSAFPVSLKAMTLISAVGIVFTAIYILFMMHKTFFGPVKKDWPGFDGLWPHEGVVLGSLAGLIVLLGLIPSLVVRYIGPALTLFLGK